MSTVPSHFLTLSLCLVGAVLSGPRRCHSIDVSESLRQHVLQQSEEVASGEQAGPFGEERDRTRRLPGLVEGVDLSQQLHRVGPAGGGEAFRPGLGLVRGRHLGEVRQALDRDREEGVPADLDIGVADEIGHQDAHDLDKGASHELHGLPDQQQGGAGRFAAGEIIGRRGERVARVGDAGDRPRKRWRRCAAVAGDGSGRLGGGARRFRVDRGRRIAAGDVGREVSRALEANGPKFLKATAWSYPARSTQTSRIFSTAANSRAKQSLASISACRSISSKARSRSRDSRGVSPSRGATSPVASCTTRRLIGPERLLTRKGA